MKLLKLKIHNLASITDAEINFDTDPIASSEVFLITGKTGSGKTTILDAICLALFASTPRFLNCVMDGKVPGEAKNLKINNAEQILRRGTGEGFSQLTFLGNDGLHYEATWSIARARKKATGKLQGKEWSLHIVEKNITIVNDKEIKPEITRAIGLDFSQFCRTTMLAQGEFTKFLNSKDNEKSDILAKITGTEIYARIGAKIFEIFSEKKRDWENANQQISNVKVLSEEEIEQMNVEKTKLDAEYGIKKQQLESINRKLQWLGNDKLLKEEINRAQAALDKARQQIDSDDFKKKEAITKEWNATIDARNWLSGKNRAANEIHRLRICLEGLLPEFERTKAGLLWLEKDIENKKEQLRKTQQFLIEQDSKKNVYANEQTISTLLAAISDCQNSIKKEQKDIDAANRLLTEDLNKKHEDAKSLVNRKQEKVKENQELLKKLNQELEEMKLPELRNKKDELAKIITNIGTALLLLDSMKKADDGVKTVEEAISSIKSNIAELDEKLKQQEAEKNSTQENRDAEKAVCDKLRESVDEWAKNIRSKLKLDDVCPVCQQKISSELPHEDLLDSIFAQAEKKLNDIENQLVAQKDACNLTKAKIETQQKQLVDKNKELEKAKDLLNNERSKALVACSKCGLTSIDSNTKQQLETLQSQTNEKIETVKQQVDAGETIEEKRNAQNRLVITFQQEHAKASNELNGIKEKIGKCNAEIQSSKRIIETKQNELNNHQNEVEKFVITSDWTANWKTEPLQFASELKKAAELFGAQVEREQRQVAAIDNANGEYNTAVDTINTIVKSMPQWQDISVTSSQEVRQLTKVANDLNTKISRYQAQIAQAQKDEAEMASLLEAWLQENPMLTVDSLVALSQHSQNEIAAMQLSLKQIHDNVLQSQTSVNDCNNRFRTHNEEKPEFAEGETSETLSAINTEVDKAVRTLGEQIGGINEKLENDQRQKLQLGQLIEECNKKKEIYDKWNRLKTQLGDDKGNVFKKIAQSYILGNLIQSANLYMRTLTDRYTLKVEPGTFVISVEDAYQGYAKRAASTISGGESFLVSLALALALSDIAQQLRVDLLFIDEGFGTLSGEPLQNAINTLRTLHNATGRQVGIISHVEELKEKIPVQVQVNQEGNSSSSTVEVVSI